MNDLSETTEPKLCRIAVVGDVCVDVIGVSVPPAILLRSNSSTFASGPLFRPKEPEPVAPGITQ
jgi:hypothetical protein